MEPYLASIVLGGGALRRGASKAVKDAILPGVVDGTKQLAFGYAEEQARFDLEDVVTTARAETQRLRAQRHQVGGAERRDAPTTSWSRRAHPAVRSTAPAFRCS